MKQRQLTGGRALILLAAAVLVVATLLGSAAAAVSDDQPTVAGQVAGGMEYDLNGNAFSISDQTGEVVSEPSTRLPYEDSAGLLGVLPP